MARRWNPVREMGDGGCGLWFELVWIDQPEVANWSAGFSRRALEDSSYSVTMNDDVSAISGSLRYSRQPSRP